MRPRIQAKRVASSRLGDTKVLSARYLTKSEASALLLNAMYEAKEKA